MSSVTEQDPVPSDDGQYNPPTTPASAASPGIVRSASVVSLSVMASRVLGLVREQIFAVFFGAGKEYDAFVTAFRIPNLLRDLFAEGALSSAFVTTFSQYLGTKGEKEAFRLSNLVATALLAVLGVCTLLGIVFAPVLVDMMAYGFSSVPGKKELTVEMTRIMAPFILLVALAAQAMGILNARGRFGIPALASAFFNLGSIAGGLLCAFVLAPALDFQPIVGMAMGTLMGGALQLAIQWPSLRAEGFRYRPMLTFSDPGVRQIMRLMGPAVIGTAAVQINVLINSNFASSIRDAAGNTIDGPVGWLNYAFRLMQFPIGVFGVAIGTVTLPAISRSAAGKNIAEFRNTLSRSLGLVFLLCIPSAAGLAILGRPIIGAIYQHGRFTAYDTGQAAGALAFYAVGLAGYAAIKVLAPAFYALDDARTPMLISIGSIAINFATNWTLVRLFDFGHRGLALSTSIVALLNFVLLLLLMRRKIQRIEGRRLLSSLVRISAATAGMAVACRLISGMILGRLGDGSFLAYMTALVIAIPAGVGVLYALCSLLGVQELKLVKEAFSRSIRKA